MKRRAHIRRKAWVKGLIVGKGLDSPFSHCFVRFPSTLLFLLAENLAAAVGVQSIQKLTIPITVNIFSIGLDGSGHAGSPHSLAES